MGTNANVNGIAVAANAAATDAANGNGSNAVKGTGIGVNGARHLSDRGDGKSDASPTDFFPFVLILLIIVVCGFIGGHGARLIAEETPRPEGAPAPSPARYYALGFIAAACVPLFLSLVQSSLITEILEKLPGEWLEALLIVAGLCLIAAVSARAFLDSLTKRVLRDLDQRVENAEEKSLAAKAQAEAAATQADAAARKADTATEIIDEQDSQPVDRGGTAPESATAGELGAAPLNGAQRDILAAVGGRTFRTIGTLAEESGLKRAEVQEVLAELENLGLVEFSLSPRTGSSRWSATARGIAALYTG